MHKLLNYKNAFRILKGGKISLVVSAFLTTATLVHAAPNGGNVTSGSATISQNGNVTNINQSTNKASINWQNFNVNPNETVNFNQPNSNSVTLNRVTGTNNSLISGAMNANGQVILVNPNGVVFTEGSSVNVGGLVATTKNITDQDFQNDNYKFEGNSNASILNKGTIKAKYVAMMGKTVQNEGRIEATLGRVELAGGNKFTLNLNNDSLLKLTIDEGTLNALVENKGIIKADGGKVYLTTQAVDTILDGVVNNTGIIEAQTLNTNQNGEIVLFAHGGTANVGGTLDASAPNGGNGGFVETSGAKVKFADDFKVKAKEWLIDPYNLEIVDDSVVESNDIYNSYGTINPQSNTSKIKASTLQNALVTGDVYLQTGWSGSQDGDLTVNSAISWNTSSDLYLQAARNIYINNNITATNNTAKLTLEYGQGAVASNNTADYNIARNVKINLADGQNFSTKLGSNGTTVNYTVVNDANALQNMSLTGNIALGSDVSLTTPASGSSNWTPIGISSSFGFTGNFDGLGHTISNLNINASNPGGNVGFFASTYGAIIQNIGLLNTSITTSVQAVGALIGNATNTIIKNSYTTGTITDSASMNSIGGLVGYIYNDGSGIAKIINSDSSVNINASNASYVGGLIGFTEGTDSTYTVEILNSNASGNVIGNQQVGGLVGEANYLTISNSFATGNVTGGAWGIGGLVGEIYNGNISTSYASGNVTGNASSFAVGGLVGAFQNANAVHDVYSIGKVTGYNEVGGLAGGLYADSFFGATAITNAWASGTVIGNSGEWVGGLIGRAVTGGSNVNTVTAGFYDSTTTGKTWSALGTSFTNANAYNMPVMPSQPYYGFDFTNTWFMVDGYTRPFLRMEWTPTITNAHQLQMMSMNLSGNYKIANDIALKSSLINKSEMWKDLGSVNYTQYLGSFVPFGDSSAQFTGSFDGQYHTISGLYIDRQGNLSISNNINNHIGFFGYTMGATIKNLILSSDLPNYESTDVYGLTEVGGLVGTADAFTKITNVGVSLAVMGYGDNIGGFAGYLVNNSSIENSYFIGQVDSLKPGSSIPNNIGGFVGRIDNSTIKDAYSRGFLFSEDGYYIGGFVGNTMNSTFQNIYTTMIISPEFTTLTVVDNKVGAFAGSIFGGFFDNIFFQSGGYFTNRWGQEVPGSGGIYQNFPTMGITNAEMKSISSFDTLSPVSWYVVGDSSLSDVYPQFRWATNGVAAGSSIWVMGNSKTPITYSISNGTTTYGTGYTLPTPSFTGGTPSATPTVKVYDSNNVDVTAQAIAGTLGAGTYTVKTLLTDNNYAIANSGNTTGSLVIGKADVNYSVSNGTTTYGTGYTLPTPSFTGGTPSATPTVKVYDSNNNDVTAQAIAGTLGAGTYTVKTLLTDNNYAIANSGNTTGSLVIGKADVNYSVSNGTTTYGTGYTLPTPSFTGGTPSATPTVKVYDSNNNDVTAQAIAGTLGAGTYTVKTLLTDNNYAIANNGNTTGSLVIGKADVNYSVSNGTTTYGTGYTLPTPSFTGGTPSATPTVKVYDSNNNDVTAQAIAGTLGAGTYTVKTLLTDNNYAIANSGNTTGSLVIGKADVNYSVSNGTTTYGTGYTLPTPSFTGGTPSATPTVKVYDSNNVDVTAQAIAGTLGAGTYTVKTLLTDNNYAIANSGNTTGSLVIGKASVVNYSINGGNITYGQNFTLPTATFSGATFTGTTTVKVYDSNNNDVTAQAIAGTLGAGTYTVKTLLTDNNYAIANSGNTTGSLVIGKADVNYSVSNGTTTYGTGYTLPTPSFTGGTPSATPTVKVYDSNNNDVTAQAIAGTLGAGTYTVKTLLTDNNYAIANSGNTTGSLVIGKADVNYSVSNGTTTYGTGYTLPTPSFTGGTPSATPTVKVYDSNNVDVTAQAIAGTLGAGTYTVKTLLTDNNYAIANSGNIDGVLIINQNVNVGNIITNIVNDTVKNSMSVNTIINTPVKLDVSNVFDKKVSSSIVNNTLTIDNNKSLGNSGLGLNDVIRSVKPDVNTVSKDTKLTVVGETGGEGKIATVELADLVAKSGGGELRVALSPDSFVELVNGGVTLPKGVSQEFYVVEDKK